MEAIFHFSGQIVRGKGNGRKVGMPTANLAWRETETDLPKLGVYISKIVIDSVCYWGLTNFGRRPSVDDEERISLETYILDFDQEILGKQADLYLLCYLRETKKFPSLQETRQQVLRDIETLRAYLREK
ncbi:MAG: riboflavin kinase [Negativicutes bacterium]|nr:riboflavin kinase [Negativicutes bacterium]